MVLIRIEGEGFRTRVFSFAAVRALPGQVAHASSLFGGREVGGVSLEALLSGLPPAAEITLESLAGDAVTLSADSIAEALLVYRLGDEPLPAERGGPVRLVGGGAGLRAIGTIRLARLASRPRAA